MIKLKNIAEIQTGVYLKPSPVANSLYLQVNNFDSNGCMYSEQKPTIALDNTNSKYLLREKDLLFVAKGTNLFCAIFQTQEYNAVASSSFLVIKIINKSSVLPEYLCWFLNLPTTLQYLSINAKGTAIPSISKATMEELNIPILSIDKQKTILAIAELQKEEERLYKRIISKRNQLTEYKLKNIINNGN